jgi:LPXTG-site transpeptidase (sortase) family protein
MTVAKKSKTRKKINKQTSKKLKFSFKSIDIKTFKTQIKKYWEIVNSEKFSSFIVLFLLFIIIFSLIGVAVFPKNHKKEAPDLPEPQVLNLIASLSAQKNMIKIDPDFSYKGLGKLNEPPVRIIIPEINIDIKVVEAEVVDGYWETATDSASFGLGSAYPKDSGNTVIFAHAREGLFLNLINIKKGMKAYVLTNTDWFNFEVKEIKTVLPHQTEVVAPTNDKTLTLYTCSGFNDAYRKVIVAKPIGK